MQKRIKRPKGKYIRKSDKVNKKNLTTGNIERKAQLQNGEWNVFGFLF